MSILSPNSPCKFRSILRSFPSILNSYNILTNSSCLAQRNGFTQSIKQMYKSFLFLETLFHQRPQAQNRIFRPLSWSIAELFILQVPPDGTFPSIQLHPQNNFCHMTHQAYRSMAFALLEQGDEDRFQHFFRNIIRVVNMVQYVNFPTSKLPKAFNNSNAMLFPRCLSNFHLVRSLHDITLLSSYGHPSACLSLVFLSFHHQHRDL